MGAGGARGKRSGRCLALVEGRCEDCGWGEAEKRVEDDSIAVCGEVVAGSVRGAPAWDASESTGEHGGGVRRGAAAVASGPRN